MSENTGYVFGSRIGNRIVEELEISPVEDFADLREIKNVQDQTCGHANIYTGGNISKVVDLSIEVVPGMRYFFIQIVPDVHLDAPRFSFDGILTSQGNRLSLDLYTDTDIGLDLNGLYGRYLPLGKIYDRAREDRELLFESSRLPHIRATCSPFFLGVFSCANDQLPRMEEYANAYLDEWINLFKSKSPVSDEQALAKKHRRKNFSRIVRDQNSMGKMVVDILGVTTAETLQNAITP
jgi:hypothetical protein